MKHIKITDNLTSSNVIVDKPINFPISRLTHQTLYGFLGLFVLFGIVMQAAVPGMIHYQGKISVNGEPFSGTGFFKFAFVSAGGDITYWSNDGSSGQGSEPASPVSLSVANGLYAVALGDTTLDGMSHAITPDVFVDHEDTRLRVWFDDGQNGSQQLTPDQRLLSAAYALMAEKAGKLAEGAQGDGSGLSGIWKMGGNHGVKGDQFIGTTDPSKFEIRANNLPALTIVPRTDVSTGASAPNMLANGGSNQLVENHQTLKPADVIGSTISGGAQNFLGNEDMSVSYATIAGGRGNMAFNSFATVSGGEDNRTGGEYASVGGGVENSALADQSSIGGGSSNTIFGEYATIAGGRQNRTSGKYSSIGGGYLNEHDSFQHYGTIGGGRENTTDGDYITIGGGYLNHAQQDYSTIGGGQANETNGEYATIGGGGSNLALASHATASGGEGNILTGKYSSIGGGYANKNLNLTQYSSIGGGRENEVGGHYAVVGGGRKNKANGIYASVGGGRNNIAKESATVGGGESNIANGTSAVIGGGAFNLAKGLHATIPGGWENIAKGMGSLAAGSFAKASHDGSFVWSDYRGEGAGHFESAYPNEFAVRAGGGVRIANQGDGARLLEFQTERPWVFRQHGAEAGADLELASLDVNGISNKHFLINTRGRIGLGTTEPRGKLHLVHEEEPPAALAPGNNGLLLGSAGDASYKWIQSYGGPLRINPKGNQVLFGEDFTMTDLDQRWVGWLDRYGKADIRASAIFGQNVYASAYLVAETILEISDRDAKTEFEEVDTTEVLHKVLNLPIETWVYKSDENGSRHMGPMAQDFRAAFGLGIDDKTIATVDADGVALAAIQGLNQKSERADEKIGRQIQRLRSSLADKERRIQDLEASVESLTALVSEFMAQSDRVASKKR